MNMSSVKINMVVPKCKTVFGQKEEKTQLSEKSPLRPRSPPVQELESLMPNEDLPHVW
jgi:hypothetical protein